MALAFDLSLPLKPQLEQARRQLQMEAFGKEVAKEGLDSLAEEAGELMRKGYLELLRIPG